MAAPSLNPRKKPGQARSAETVRVILEAAARILEEHGFASYTTNAVAEKAGVSIGSLYQYFPGKEALTAALIERETAILLDDVAAIEGMEDGGAALRRLIVACVAHQMRRPALARLLDFEEQRLPVRQRMQRMSVTLMQAIFAILKQLQLEDIPDLDVAAADVLAIIKGIVDAAGERGEAAPASLEQRVTRAVFGYLGQQQSITASCI